MFEEQLNQLMAAAASVGTVDTEMLTDAYLAAKTNLVLTGLPDAQARIAMEQARVRYLDGKLARLAEEELWALKKDLVQRRLAVLENELRQERVSNFMELIIEHVPELSSACDGQFVQVNDALLTKYYGDLKDVLQNPPPE
jgi:hypothetical protein